jgi:hypothetical protein
MIEDIVTFTSVGFGLSMLVYFQGQVVRLFVEVIEVMAKR